MLKLTFLTKNKTSTQKISDSHIRICIRLPIIKFVFQAWLLYSGKISNETILAVLHFFLKLKKFRDLKAMQDNICTNY